MHLVCSVLLLLGGLQLTCAQLTVGAFNIQIFGEKKSQDYEVMQSIAQIVRRYDVVVIQEVRDSKPTTPVIDNLMAYVNQASTDYDCEFSTPLGDSNQKERYVYLYRTNRVAVRSTYQYPDPAKKFSRPPYAVQFRSNMPGAVFDFALVPLHSKPTAAVTEIDALVDVVTAINALPNWTDNILLLGDFNAGCRYVSQSAWRNIRLHQPAYDYEWLIGHNVVTNLNENCPYDRIVATRAMDTNHVMRNTAGIYNFKNILGLTQAEAEDVSDHYPVEVMLR